MSVTITTDVFCDRCSRWDHYTTGQQSQIREAQQAAKRAGWTFDRKGDCKCPECNGSKPLYGYWGHNSEPHQLR